MKKMLYYPGFEYTDENFLKIALLYFDKLTSIVPYSGREYLSSEFNKIMRNTDLLGTYHPNYDDGVKATSEVIKNLDHILRYPNLHRREFGYRFLNNWKHKHSHRLELFSDKYNIELVEYLQSNNLCTESNNGIKVAHDLGYLYMTFLANVIRSESEMDIITDVDKAKRVSKLTRMNSQDKLIENEYDAIEKLINIEVPRNLNDISFDEIINLRNSPNFKEKLSAFHESINKFEDTTTLDKFSIIGMKQEIEDSKSELGVGDLLVNAGSFVSLSVSSVSCMATQGLGIEEIGLLATFSIFVGSVYNSYKILKPSDTKLGAQSYLLDIGSL